MNNQRPITNACSKDHPSASYVIEVFVQDRFCDFELSSIIATLQTANKVKSEDIFDWRIVSDKPGLVNGAGCGIVRAAPAIHGYGFSDCMIVISSENMHHDNWLKRARMMVRLGLRVALLSKAATQYILETKITSGAITTHWLDIDILNETGFYPRLTSQLSEKTNGVITSAGSGTTIDLVLGLISEFLQPHEIAEIGNRLLINNIRMNTAEQPKNISNYNNLFNKIIKDTIELMECNISEPLSISEIATEIGVSTRHLERQFKRTLKMPPSRFYRYLRVKSARNILVETDKSISDVALATGFSSTNSMSIAFRKALGKTPTEIRLRDEIRILQYGE